MEVSKEYKDVDIESYNKGWIDCTKSILEVMEYWDTHNVRSSDGVPNMMLPDAFQEANRNKDRINFIKEWIADRITQDFSKRITNANTT
jgi:hypothetical protein